MLDGLSPPRRASSAPGRRGAKPEGKPKGGPFHPGGHRRGEDRTGQLLEPSSMPREAKPRTMGCRSGVQGLAAEKRRVPVKETTWPGEHRRPRGREGTHPGHSSCVRNAVTPSGSGRALGVSGKADREEGPTPRREQDGREANAGGRKTTGNHESRTGPPAVVVDNRPDTGPRDPARKSADAAR